MYVIDFKRPAVAPLSSLPNIFPSPKNCNVNKKHYSISSLYIAYECKDEGFFPHTTSCKKYFWCLDVPGSGMVAHTFTCPQGNLF